MFIEQGSFVNIMAGAWAGRTGVVRKMRIDDYDGSVMVAVDVITNSGADFEMALFEPIQLKRRKLSPRQAERLELMHQSHLIEEEERKAAA